MHSIRIVMEGGMDTESIPLCPDNAEGSYFMSSILMVSLDLVPVMRRK